MEKLCVFEIAAILVLSFSLQGRGEVGQTLVHGCSNYTFHIKTLETWESSRKICRGDGGDLVSIESKEEWYVLKDTIQNLSAQEYFIGLRKVKHSKNRWIWLSNNSSNNEHWKPNDPSGDGDCVVMFKDYEKHFGLFNDLSCASKRDGYICEGPVRCIDNKATSSPTKATAAQTTRVTSVTHSSPTTQRQTSEQPTGKIATFPRKSEAKPVTPHKALSVEASSTAPISFQTLLMTLKIHSKLSTQNRSGKDVSTKIYTNKPDTFDESPDVKGTKNSSSLILIILSLLAVIILAILIIFFVLFARRRRSNKAKASLLREQSSDRDHYLHSSTELTVHFSMSRPEEGLSTLKTVSESKDEYTYAVVDKNKPKSRCNESSNFEQGEQQQTTPDDGHFTNHPVLVESEERIEKTADKEDRKDHVYAAVHIQQGKAAVCRDPALQEENVDATYAPNSTHEGGARAEVLNSSSLEHGKEVTNSEAADGQNKCEEYLYAAVDKASKKQRPPQMPSPYRGLVYADMSHLPEKNTGNINRANAPTVYAAISHQKTEGAKSRLPKESEDQQTTYNNNEL